MTDLRNSVNEWGQPIGRLAADPACERPIPAPMPGQYGSVVPLDLSHAAGLYQAVCVDSPDETWTYMAVGPFANQDEFAAQLQSWIDDQGAEPYAILDADGTPRGLAQYLRIDPSNGSIEVGSIVFGASMRRTPLATEAMYLMARHVLDGLGYRRYEWKCDDLNAPSRAAAARLGFRYEGTWRNALVYKGRNRDTAWYSITDDEWRRLRPAWEQWLDPSNFDDAGRQLRSLSELTEPHSHVAP